MTVFVLLVLVVFGWGLVAIYNHLVRLKNQVDNALAQIEVQLKRRHDLIPNLVQSAKAYLGHENNTLVQVTKARNQLSARQPTTDWQTVMAQENALSQALANFYAVAESYPELKADALVVQVMNELSNTENRIGFARQHYNDSVMSYNNSREMFPNNLLSNFFRFEARPQLQFLDSSEIQTPPSVTF